MYGQVFAREHLSAEELKDLLEAFAAAVPICCLRLPTTWPACRDRGSRSLQRGIRPSAPIRGLRRSPR